jgi:glutamyl/glutaminyl-tRNA synthetase
MSKVVSRVGITPVGSPMYRLNRLRLHLLAYAIARKAKLDGAGGAFIIRCDDTDKTKIDHSYLDAYIDTLSELGITPDYGPYGRDQNGYPYFQSQRVAIYQRYLAELISKDLAYKEVSGAILFNVTKFAGMHEGFLSDQHLHLRVNDACIGTLSLDIRSESKTRGDRSLDLVDFPIVRSNGEFLYNFCSPVDDGVLGVTHIIRDRDKINLLAKQEMIRVSLGFQEPVYVHAPILVDHQGKRFVYDPVFGDATFENVIDHGILPAGLLSYLLSTLFGPSESFYASLDDFCSKLDLARLHCTNTAFSAAVLQEHNKRAMASISTIEYEKFLKAYLRKEHADLLRKLEEKPDLLSLLSGSKRHMTEAREIIEYLLAPSYDRSVIEEVGFRNLVKKLIELDESKMDIRDVQGNAERTGMSLNDYHQALRYVTTGRRVGISTKEVVSFLDEHGLFEGRVSQARDLVKQYE